MHYNKNIEVIYKLINIHYAFIYLLKMHNKKNMTVDT